MANPTSPKDTEAANEANQTANVQVSRKYLASNLFQVMRIVPDKQDLSFVEKVQILEDKILDLCNRIVPNSAEKQNRYQNQSYNIRIDFNSLNRLSLPTIGFYGDKGTMGRILKEMGVVDDSIHTQMQEEEKFEAGLYIGHLKQVIVVFYWHQGTHLPVASRNQASCNFIRYVVDLCDDVYVCVEEHNLLEALAAKSMGQKRTQRFKVSICATLEYIYHIFDKFAVTPALCGGSMRDLNFYVLAKSIYTPREDTVQSKCEEYLKLLVQQLDREKGKDFSNLRIQFQVHMSESWHSIGVVFGPSHPKKPLGNWIRQLISLVPIQVTRAEKDGLQPLLDGFRMPPHLTYTDSVSLANLLSFGLYDAVLKQWDGKIKVVSSMGTQSSVKSYLLNHLSGSLFDVAGGRCTDGVWMTVRMDSECLYVLMDVEGLGSFEMTEQEDMLLSVLNAALSTITIFNQKDFHLDKETQSIFQRFQSAVSLVKNDEKLFKGLFYIAIKDVDAYDIEELKEEFHEKLLEICRRSPENFLVKMYGGEFQIDAMPPFTRRDYQESLSEIALYIKEELKHSYESGRVFLRDLKLVIAQLAAKDWTPVDSKRVAMKVDILRRNLDSAVQAGCLSILGVNKMLINFDDQEEVGDPPIELGDPFIDLEDTGLELASLDESMSIDEILSHLRSRLESAMERRGEDGDLWHSKFQVFLGALADRRRHRVKEWLRCNTAEFSWSHEVQMLEREADLALANLKLKLSVCGCKCSVCFWLCAQKIGHSSNHSCMANHVCVEKCTYCSLLSHQGIEVEECRNLAGHAGNHDCKRKNHTCVGKCALFDKSSNCSESCSLKVGHDGPHKCNSPQHRCRMRCSLGSCNNTCVQQIDLSNHQKHARDEKHACHERYCPKKCIMEGCPRSCGYEDHFHESKSKKHLCGNEHACSYKCEADGICEIYTELMRHTRPFQGRRGSFQSEQNGLRKDCCVVIPPFKKSHDGMHIHTLNPKAVHYCNVRCPACKYICHKPINHSGLHHTVHGNTRNTIFASDHEEFNIEGRKYVWGESDVAETCNMHCKKQGRGHIHLIHCPVDDSCKGHIYDGSRHETTRYGPDVEVPKDELTHETYWKHMRFEDPCTEEDGKEFALCNHFCNSEAHTEIDGTFSRSYCREKLWHNPIERTASISSAAHVTVDGHVFNCNHPIPHHVVFVIDRSASMSKTDIKPTMANFTRRHNCRLGCVYEGIVRFITTRRRTFTDDSLSVVLFSRTADLALEMQEMKKDLVDNLLQYPTKKGTRFLSGLEMAGKVIARGSNTRDVAKQKPTIIFFSDGDNDDRDDPLHYVRGLKEREPRMTLHTIFFGKASEEKAVNILKKMAEIGGNGLYLNSVDEMQLARSFETIATSLEPGRAASTSLRICNNTRVEQIDLGNHEKHASHERYCPKKCIMEGCPRSCGYEDHFHESKSNEHLCGNEHACPYKCEADGICEIYTELVRHTRSFQGRRTSFQYEHVSEQNGLRKDCCVVIPPFKRSHDGMHIHTLNPKAVHYCKVRCPACEYICHKPINHSGLHHTVHGNMRNTILASDQEEFDIEGRKYVWGESGVAEMCNMHCKKQGRGHIHLIHCPVDDSCTGHIYDGSRHETTRYGPDVKVPKDELTHETYWKHIQFEDPYSEGDRKEFALCNDFCKSEAHTEIDGTFSRSYCKEKLWHAPVKRTASIPPAAHVTIDRHVCLCNHPKSIPHHVVFVIDRSASMSKDDIKPSMVNFPRQHKCRLGCVYEGIVRFITNRRRTVRDDSLSVVLFASTADLALVMQEMKEDIVENLLQYPTKRGTRFSSGLELAGEVIARGSNNPVVANRKPTIIFFSDGDNDDGDDPLDYVSCLKEREPRMTLHTIFFGKASGEKRSLDILKKMAEIGGNGLFQSNIDEMELARSLGATAVSLEPGCAVPMLKLKV